MTTREHVNMHTLPAIRQRPRPYNPDADADLRAAMVSIIEAVPAKERVGFALAFSLRALGMLARNAPGNAQRSMCHAYIDAFEDVVPASIRRKIERAMHMSKEG